eukprot:jgi/Tetstr1/427313/TSEL_017482.t1
MESAKAPSQVPKRKDGHNPSLSTGGKTPLRKRERPTAEDVKGKAHVPQPSEPAPTPPESEEEQEEPFQQPMPKRQARSSRQARSGPAEDVRASPPKGGANPAFAPCCPRCKDNPGVTPCFRLFISLHPNTAAMMPAGPEWRILSYHVPGVCAFMPEVDDENEAYRLQHDTARTMAAAKEIRHWNPEAHIGDDEYIVANVKPAVVEAAM